MPRKELPEPTGKCSICTINLYGNPPHPMVMPCGIHRQDEQCPYESEKEFTTYMAKWYAQRGFSSPTGEAET